MDLAINELFPRASNKNVISTFSDNSLEFICCVFAGALWGGCQVFNAGLEVSLESRIP